METIIYLIRHGETDWNREKRYQGQQDIPLNDLGRKQAFQLAKRLLNERYKIDAVYSSNLLRAKETAEIIAHHFDLKVQVHEGLKERHFGLLEGTKLEDFKAKYPDLTMRDIDQYEFFRAEPFQSFKERMYNAVLEVAQNHMNGKILLISHGAAIHSFLHEITDGEFSSNSTKIVNTGITTIQYDYSNQKWSIIEINNVAHIGA